MVFGPEPRKPELVWGPKPINNKNRDSPWIESLLTLVTVAIFYWFCLHITGSGISQQLFIDAGRIRSLADVKTEFKLNPNHLNRAF